MEQLGKDPAIISKWVTNASQPNMKTIVAISKLLGVDINELIRSIIIHETYEQERNYT